MRVAGIDMGTNSTRLLVGEISRPRRAARDRSTAE